MHRYFKSQYLPSQCVSLAIPPVVPGCTGAFFSKLPPPPGTSGSAANFFNVSIVTPFVSADSSVAWRKTLFFQTRLAPSLYSNKTREGGEKSILRHNRIIRPLRRIHRLLPSRGAQTPFAACVEAGDLAEVVAARGGEVEEFFCQETCFGCVSESRRFWRDGVERERGELVGWKEGKCTSNGMISTVLRSDSAISVAVEARQGFLGEEGEGFLEDCLKM